ncbi:EF-P 5-aminopentanol modification-associated protein YfmH [Agrilactobacillus fermenti]|uniref:EF-P 5-aminopentanol modification-associated protein YfmH n=1 Tax=Agrilactobacillus fermenti TaxID=2586909 RepID=UPI001E2D0038|nr:pitrilysin family protein [Agrilactobacillus fermenti]MCD2257264.1 insulinase family protein [Agrilactobacillus fermenti]
MKTINFSEIGEQLHQIVLDNGLQVNILPKQNYHKTFAILTTNYGSIDINFAPVGSAEVKHYPAGIAHFLEHKMFEKADHDAFDLFGKYGADANAFTSYTKTSYLFSSTDYVHENLDILLDFVQDPYFSEASVAKEKGIIAQEIKMYDDDADWRGEMGLIGNLFPNHPIHLDIAGTVQSIDQITPAALYEAYRTFYVPKNMNLFIASPLDPQQLATWIQENQATKHFEANKRPKRATLNDQSPEDIMIYRFAEMPVKRSKSFVGVKGPDESTIDRSGLVRKIKLQFLLQMLFGVSSQNFAELYRQGIVDDSFGFEVMYERSANFVMLYGDAEDPGKFSDTILNLLETAKDSPDLTAEHLQRLKQKRIGELLFSFNSLESIANLYNNNNFNEATIFDVWQIINDLTITDLQDLAAAYFLHDNTSVFHVVPKQTENEK